MFFNIRGFLCGGVLKWCGVSSSCSRYTYDWRRKKHSQMVVNESFFDDGSLGLQHLWHQ